MPGQIFNIQDNGALVPMDETPFENEDLFQDLLAKYPNLLAGDQIDSSSPRRWLLVQREMGVPGEEAGGERWSLDHLFLDQDAIPTLVEVKRSSDTRLRREVVGQMLDYAANAVVYWPVEEMRAKYAQTCEAQGTDPDQFLLDFLGEEGDPERFWQQVKTNLQAKKIRLLFVADVIPPELRRIVEFLNDITDPTEVLAVEIIRHHLWSASQMAEEQIEFDDVALLRAFASIGSACEKKGDRLVAQLADVLEEAGIGNGKIAHDKGLFKNHNRSVLYRKLFDSEGYPYPVLLMGISDQSLWIWFETPPRHESKSKVGKAVESVRERLKALNSRWFVWSGEEKEWCDIYLQTPLSTLLNVPDQDAAFKEFFAKALDDIKKAGVVEAIKKALEQK